MKIILFFCLIIFFFNAYPQNNKSVDDLYTEGVSAYEKKDYKQFLENFKILDSLRSNNQTIMYNLACAYSLNHQKENAIKYLKKYILIDANKGAANDNDFGNIKDSPEFKEILDEIEKLNQPINNSEIAFQINEKDLHPESIAYDEKTKKFFMGSIHKRKIISIDNTIDDNGKTEIFIPEKQDRIWSVSGIKIDSKRRVLWATSIAIPQMIDYNENLKGMTAVFKFDIDKKKLIKKYLMPEDGNEHYFGDLVINKNGDAFITDSKYPAIYLIKNGSDELNLFYKNDELKSLQGIDFSSDEKFMFFADYSSGIYRLDSESKKTQKIIEPSDYSLKGIDGLYFYNNSLIAIQNGVNPKRLTQYFLDENLDKIISVKIIERANPHFNEPTLGVIVKKDFYYIANSQWESYNKDGSIFPEEKLEDIIVFKVNLEK